MDDLQAKKIFFFIFRLILYVCVRRLHHEKVIYEFDDEGVNCSRKLESKAVVVPSQFLNYLSRPRIHSSHTGFAICINGIMGISCGEAATQIFHPSFFFCFLLEKIFIKKEIEFALYLFLFYGG